MAITVRLPDELKAEVEAYAKRLGLSLNGLIAVSLRDYIDRRRFMEAKSRIANAAEREEELYVIKAPKNPRSPCPCNSGQQYRHCHGKSV